MQIEEQRRIGHQLHDELGQELSGIGLLAANLREDALKTVRDGGERPGGMSTEQLFDYQVQQSLIESEGFDLMVMGRPEGPGCYCAANNIIRKYSDKLSDQYRYVVIDNEAGMEHLSRRTTHAVDLLLIVSDPTVRGVKTADRIHRLVDELDLDVKARVLIINRVSGDETGDLVPLAEGFGLRVAGLVPQDRRIFENDLAGRGICGLTETESPAVKEIYRVLDGLEIP